MVKGVSAGCERLFLYKRLSITSGLRCINSQDQPKCELEDGNNRQPNDAGNVSERHSVYPTTALSGTNPEPSNSENDTDLTDTTTRARSAQMVQVKVLYHTVVSHLQYMK